MPFSVAPHDFVAFLIAAYSALSRFSSFTPGTLTLIVQFASLFVQAGGGRWWYDAAAWNRYRDRQWKRLVVGAIVIIVICALVVLALMMR